MLTGVELSQNFPVDTNSAVYIGYIYEHYICRYTGSRQIPEVGTQKKGWELPGLGSCNINSCKEKQQSLQWATGCHKKT